MRSGNVKRFGAVTTRGNFVVTDDDGTRIAAFAMEEDARRFVALGDIDADDLAMERHADHNNGQHVDRPDALCADCASEAAAAPTEPGAVGR